MRTITFFRDNCIVVTRTYTWVIKIRLNNIVRWITTSRDRVSNLTCKTLNKLYLLLFRGECYYFFFFLRISRVRIPITPMRTAQYSNACKFKTVAAAAVTTRQLKRFGRKSKCIPIFIALINVRDRNVIEWLR